MKGASARPAVRWAFATTPMPLVQVCGVKTRFASCAMTATRRSPVMPPTSAASGCSTSRQPLAIEVAKLVELAGHLAAGDADVDHLAQAPHARAVGAVQRLLHPVDAEPLQLARHRQRVLQRPGRLGVPGHAPALVAVDHQLQRGRRPALRTASSARISSRQSPRWKRIFSARKPCSTIALRRLGQRAGIAQRAGGGVGRHAVGEPAEQLPDRLAGDLAGEVPQREVERPAAAVVELDVRRARGSAARSPAGPGR